MRIGKRSGKRRTIRHAQQLGLPEDVVLGLPRLVLRGNTSLTLENHHGALEYGSTLIKMRTNIGALCVTGKDFTLTRMGKHDLMLRGTIESVTFDTSAKALGATDSTVKPSPAVRADKDAANNPANAKPKG